MPLWRWCWYAKHDGKNVSYRYGQRRCKRRGRWWTWYVLTVGPCEVGCWMLQGCAGCRRWRCDEDVGEVARSQLAQAVVTQRWRGERLGRHYPCCSESAGELTGSHRTDETCLIMIAERSCTMALDLYESLPLWARGWGGCTRVVCSDAEAGRDSGRDGGRRERRRKTAWKRERAERKRARNGSVCAPGMRMGK
jgi:hypothetical protein